MNAVVYARFSSHRQGEQSIEGQVAEAERFAAEHGLAIIHVYADRAQTGRNDNREQFQLMLADAAKHFEEESPRGEYVIVIEGASEPEESENFWDSMTVCEHVEYYVNQGKPDKEAIKLAATDRGMPKREVYDEYHGIKRGQ